MANAGVGNKHCKTKDDHKVFSLDSSGISAEETIGLEQKVADVDEKVL